MNHKQRNIQATKYCPKSKSCHDANFVSAGHTIGVLWRPMLTKLASWQFSVFSEQDTKYFQM